jgi:hypothetical protein
MESMTLAEYLLARHVGDEAAFGVAWSDLDVGVELDESYIESARQRIAQP